MKTAETEYEPFGLEWAKEINKIPKALIIEMLSKKGKEVDELRASLHQSEKPADPEKLTDSDLWFVNNLKCLIDLELELIKQGKQVEINRSGLAEWLLKYSPVPSSEVKDEDCCCIHARNILCPLHGADAIINTPKVKDKFEKRMEDEIKELKRSVEELKVGTERSIGMALLEMLDRILSGYRKLNPVSKEKAWDENKIYPLGKGFKIHIQQSQWEGLTPELRSYFADILPIDLSIIRDFVSPRKVEAEEIEAEVKHIFDSGANEIRVCELINNLLNRCLRSSHTETKQTGREMYEFVPRRKCIDKIEVERRYMVITSGGYSEIWTGAHIIDNKVAKLVLLPVPSSEGNNTKNEIK